MVAFRTTFSFSFAQLLNCHRRSTKFSRFSYSVHKLMSVFYENYVATLFEKSNFCPKIQFWQNSNIFTSFSPNFFLTIFLVKSKLSTAKKSKTTTFSRVFHPQKSTIFSGNQSWIFGQKMKISNSVTVWPYRCRFLLLLYTSSLTGSFSSFFTFSLEVWLMIQS